MAGYGDAYSRLVAWLKIILPLVALAILSTLFLLARTIDPSQSIPYADYDTQKLAQEQRIGKPNYAGMTKDGSSIVITAESATPESSTYDQVSLVAPTAKMETANGLQYQMMAAAGSVNNASHVAKLSGDVSFSTSDGYIARTQSISTNLVTTEVQTDGSITADGPLGHLEAGQMVLTRDPTAKSGAGYVLVFKDGVKLVYEPKG